MAPCRSKPFELNAFQIQATTPFNSAGPLTALRTEPSHCGQLGLEGCGDPAGGCQEGLARRLVLCHQTNQEVVCGKIQNWRQWQRLCVCGCVSTQTSPVRGTDVKCSITLLVQVPSLNVMGNYTTSRSAQCQLLSGSRV